jgi:hypothetical protein
MEEFEKTLSKLTSGDMSLMNELGKMRLAMQLSVSEAFQTPEVISMFAVCFLIYFKKIQETRTKTFERKIIRTPERCKIRKSGTKHFHATNC